MAIIKASDFISSGYSKEDAEALVPSINSAKTDGSTTIIVDFAGVQYFTTLFFSAALTYLIGELGEEGYQNRVQVTNLSESGEETYKHALDYAIEFFKKTPEERESELEITTITMEDI